MADFCVLTPSEWEAVYDHYREMVDEREKCEWERMRLLCAYTIQPHMKKKVHPKKMMPFPWDDEQRKESQNIVSPEEGRARYEKLMKKLEVTDEQDIDRCTGGT